MSDPHMRTVALALILAGCSPYSLGGSTTAPISAFGPARADVGTICVIRSSTLAQAVTFIVHDNQQLVGGTRGHSYFCYEAEAGPHDIVSDTFDSTDSPGRTRVMIQPGGRYWLQQDHAGLGSITSILTWVDPQRAANLIADCDYKQITAVPGHETIPPPVPFARVASR
jgi:hypothetical protein